MLRRTASSHATAKKKKKRTYRTSRKLLRHHTFQGEIFQADYLHDGEVTVQTIAHRVYRNMEAWKHGNAPTTVDKRQIKKACKSHTSRRRGRLREAISTAPDLSGSGRVDMLTRPVAAARATYCCRMYLTRGNAGASRKIRRRTKTKLN